MGAGGMGRWFLTRTTTSCRNERVARFPHNKKPVVCTSRCRGDPSCYPFYFWTPAPQPTSLPKGTILWYSTLPNQPPWPFRHVGNQASRPHSRWNMTIMCRQGITSGVLSRVPGRRGQIGTIPDHSADPTTLMTSERHCVHTRRAFTDTGTSCPA